MPTKRRTVPRKKRLQPRKSPTQARSQKTVEEILEATARILQKEGVLELSTNKVARVAGVSIGSLYQFFPNKESLLAALVERKILADKTHFERELAGIEEWTFPQQLRRIAEVGIVLHRQEEGLFKIMFEQLQASGQANLAREMNRLFHDILLGLMLRHSRFKTDPKTTSLKARLYATTLLAVWHEQVEESWLAFSVGDVVDHVSGMILADSR